MNLYVKFLFCGIIICYVFMDVFQLIKKIQYPIYIKYHDENNVSVFIYFFPISSRRIICGKYYEYSIKRKNRIWMGQLNSRDKDYLKIVFCSYAISIIGSIIVFLYCYSQDLVQDEFLSLFFIFSVAHALLIGIILYGLIRTYIFFLFDYYILRKWLRLNGKQWPLYQGDNRKDYLNRTSFLVKDILGDNAEILNDRKLYTVVLVDDYGHEEIIKTTDIQYYEEKMRTGETIRIGKVRTVNK